jgi:hypothetical protein
MERRKFIKGLGASALLLGVAPSTYAGIGGNRCKEEVCREAWNKLSKDALKMEAFAYVHPKKRLPNVFIYGDSISIGYTVPVRKALEGKVNVFRFFQNGETSHHLIPGIEELQKAMFQSYLPNGWNFEWNLIHFNVGLHDLKYLKDGKLDKENGTQVSTIEEYKINLHKDCRYLMETFPKAKLVFATTTPVPEGADGRFAGDSIKYNKAALEVLSNYPSIIINDLYSFTKPNFEKWSLNPGNVHYNNEGKVAQGKEVARIIAENL